MDFEELFERYGKMVYNLTVRMCGIQDAEDLTQDIFIKIHDKLESFRNEAKISTWIYRIAMNENLKYLQKRKLKSFFLFQSLGEVADERITSQDANDLQLQFQTAIQSLPAGQQTAIQLFFYENLSQKEIAEITKSTIASVESRIHRAKQNLGKLLGEKYRSGDLL